uniref:Uncharacterized protein n=1 Tax=Vespula pensylvanica TaxID=30213 RepID=A0A834JUH3_VESPE|nr:hypothetical protein H0235_016985 [Vespula pensylvanica]
MPEGIILVSRRRGSPNGERVPQRFCYPILSSHAIAPFPNNFAFYHWLNSFVLLFIASALKEIESSYLRQLCFGTTGVLRGNDKTTDDVQKKEMNKRLSSPPSQAPPGNVSLYTYKAL